jgi:SNF2 family DNA or RNA helicase
MDNKNSLKIPYEGFSYLPHQIHGVKWLLSREEDVVSHFHGGILADDMGLGKTWQLIGLLLNSSEIKKTLLVIPASLQETWIYALIKADITIMSKQNSKSMKWRKEYVSKKRDVRVYIISYDRFVNSCKYGLLDCEKMPWGRVVCDEAQNIRNGSKTGRFNKLMEHPPCIRWLLTGTPFQNRESDLTNLFEWLHGSSIPSSTSLSVLVNDCILRRTYSDLRVTDGLSGIPEPYERHTISCDTVSIEESNLLDKLLGKIEFAKEHTVPPFILLEMYLRMNQAMAHPVVYHDSMRKKAKAHSSYYKWEDWSCRDSGKQVALRNLVISDAIQPTIIFCSFTSESEMVEKELAKLGYNHIYQIDGSVGFSSRQESIETGRKLVEKNAKDVAFVVQWIAGGAGLNLQFCSRIIFYTQHWNPAIIQQAIGRAHRIGQKNRVQVYSLCFEFEEELNMDQLMISKQEEKMEIAHSIMPSLLEEDSTDK